MKNAAAILAALALVAAFWWQGERFIAANGTELATLQGKPGDELLLAFTGAADPFTRMALLGAALSRA